MGHAEFARHPLQIVGAPTPGEAGFARDHRKFRQPGEGVDQILGEAVAHVAEKVVARQIVEGQHGERGRLGAGVDQRSGLLWIEQDPVGADRLGDVLDPLLAQVGEAKIGLAAHLVEYLG